MMMTVILPRMKALSTTDEQKFADGVSISEIGNATHASKDAHTTHTIQINIQLAIVASDTANPELKATAVLTQILE